MRSVVTLITLGIDDMARARAFYAVLGWREAAGSSDDITFLHGTGPALGLWSRVAGGGLRVTQDPGGWGGITLAHNVGSPDEVDAVLAEAQDAGGTVVRAAVATDWGGYSGVFADPDGHRWEVAHNPFWPLDEDGHSTLPE
ncbi:MAG TPA: VOC family protein [Pseudonocardiaceae bacterium]|nr:VOC family protein [Pseudonocardiaceae bacterium]